jgi:hypothetical protein
MASTGRVARQAPAVSAPRRGDRRRPPPPAGDARAADRQPAPPGAGRAPMGVRRPIGRAPASAERSVRVRCPDRARAGSRGGRRERAREEAQQGAENGAHPRARRRAAPGSAPSPSAIACTVDEPVCAPRTRATDRKRGDPDPPSAAARGAPAGGRPGRSGRLWGGGRGGQRVPPRRREGRRGRPERQVVDGDLRHAGSAVSPAIGRRNARGGGSGRTATMCPGGRRPRGGDRGQARPGFPAAPRAGCPAPRSR